MLSVVHFSVLYFNKYWNDILGDDYILLGDGDVRVEGLSNAWGNWQGTFN